MHNNYGFAADPGDLLGYAINIMNEIIDIYVEVLVVSLAISKALDNIWHIHLKKNHPYFGLPPIIFNSIADYSRNG